MNIDKVSIFCMFCLFMTTSYSSSYCSKDCVPPPPPNTHKKNHKNSRRCFIQKLNSKNCLRQKLGMPGIAQKWISYPVSLLPIQLASVLHRQLVIGQGRVSYWLRCCFYSSTHRTSILLFLKAISHPRLSKYTTVDSACSLAC